jgi:hypothetical protein
MSRRAAGTRRDLSLCHREVARVSELVTAGLGAARRKGQRGALGGLHGNDERSRS